MISVELIPSIMTWIGPKQLREKEMKLDIIVHENKYVKTIIDTIQNKKISVYHIRIRDLKDGGHLIQLNIGVNYKLKLTNLYELISNMEGVKQVEIESLH